MCNILHLRNDVSRAKKKVRRIYRVISAQNHLRPGQHHILNLYNNSAGKNKEGIQIWSNKQCHLLIFYCYTLSSFMSRTTRGRGKSENIIMLSHQCNGDSQHRLFDMGKTRVYRGSFNQFFLIFALRHRLWVLVKSTPFRRFYLTCVQF